MNVIFDSANSLREPFEVLADATKVFVQFGFPRPVNEVCTVFGAENDVVMKARVGGHGWALTMI
jgi:hypothetical protein